ncbi:hypothetical protein B0H34DRAFT_200262 [Crassisporium funariophilum]|nr:hypothetical protein B0H34DRAFT_200262 [Crassisporium funariophilum]
MSLLAHARPMLLWSCSIKIAPLSLISLSFPCALTSLDFQYHASFHHSHLFDLRCCCHCSCSDDSKSHIYQRRFHSRIRLSYVFSMHNLSRGPVLHRLEGFNLPLQDAQRQRHRTVHTGPRMRRIRLLSLPGVSAGMYSQWIGTTS